MKKEMKALVNVKVVLEDRILPEGVVLWEGDRILAVGKRSQVKIPDGAEIIDGKGGYVGPGFVDIHVHGGGGVLFYEDPVKVAKHLLFHGETTVLAGFYYSMTPEEHLSGTRLVKKAMREGTAPNLAGLYMEGPYLNTKYGGGSYAPQWERIDPEDYLPLMELAGEDARVWAVAPEREGIEGFLQDYKRVNPKGVVAVAHSEASPREIRRLKPYGLTLQTHCTNATGRPRGPVGTRSCGPDEECLMSPEMYAEVICDSQGIHVPRDMMELILCLKGRDRVILITDGFVSEGENPAEYAHVTDLCFGSRGELQGSLLTMDVALRSFISHLGVSLWEAFLAASLNPARALGMDGEIGSIEAGKRADLVLLNSDYELVNVVLRGEFQK